MSAIARYHADSAHYFININAHVTLDQGYVIRKLRWTRGNSIPRGISEEQVAVTSFILSSGKSHKMTRLTIDKKREKCLDNMLREQTLIHNESKSTSYIAMSFTAVQGFVLVTMP